VGRSFCKQAHSCCNKDVAKHERKSPLQTLTKQNKTTVKEREREKERHRKRERQRQKEERKKERKRERKTAPPAYE